MNKIIKKQMFYTGSDLYEILKEKAHSHRAKIRKYLPNISCADIAVKNNALIISKGGNFNDLNDNFIASKNETYFMATLSYGREEKLSMWLIYSSANGNCGCALEYDNKDISCINERTTMFYVKYDKNDVIKLAKVKNPKVDYSNVLYVSKGKTTNITTNNKSLNVTKYRNIDKILKSSLIRNVSKDYFWSHEQEVRLIIKVNKKDVPEDCDAIMIKIEGKKLTNNNIVLHPAYKEDNIKGYATSSIDNIDWSKIKINI